MKRFLPVLTLALLLTGCVTEINTVQPQPVSFVKEKTAKVAIVIDPAIKDEYFTEWAIGGVQVNHIRESVENGFKSVAGAQLAAQESADYILHFDRLEMQSEAQFDNNLYWLLRFHGQWQRPNGEIVKEFADTAQPRQPSNIYEKRVEDPIAGAIETAFAKLNDDDEPQKK